MNDDDDDLGEDDLDEVLAEAEAQRKAQEELMDINNYFGEDGLLRNEQQRQLESNYRIPEKPSIITSLKQWRKLEIKKIF